MIQTVFAATLPVGERLVVHKNRIEGRGGKGPRIAVVTGIHGDELEGQYVAFELAQRLRERLGDLRGVVDIYPALNPLGMSAASHGVPLFDLDLDRTFPGNPNGSLNEALAAAIVADIKGANACVDIQAPDAHLRELSQVRVEEQFSRQLLPLAQLLNTQLVWVHSNPATQRATLAHALNTLRTRTLTVEIGESLHITADSGNWLCEGILRLVEELGGWKSSSIALPTPRVVHDDDVISVTSEAPGVFLPHVEHGSVVRRGDLLGVVADPLGADILREVLAPVGGLVFSLRAQPIVYPGTMVARILGGYA